MSAKIEWQRSDEKKSSISELLDHDDYLGNTKHHDHEGYTLLAGKNYNCSGPNVGDLVAGVELAHANYIRRKELLKIRRRTPILWGEAIFAFDAGCFTTAEEREKIEREYIKRFFRDAAARATWHVNEATGACDLHIIFAHKRPCGKLTLERTNVKMEKRLQALDRFAVTLVNNNPNKPENRIPDIQTSEAVGEADAQKYSEIREENEAAELAAKLAEEEAKNPKKKKKSATKTAPAKKKASTTQSRKLAAQVARQAEDDGIEDVEARHLPGILERLKIKIKQIIGGIIKYESSRKIMKGKTAQGEIRVPRTGIIRIHDFLLDVLHAQIDLRIERKKEMAMTNPQPIQEIQSPTLEIPTWENPTLEIPEDASAPIKNTKAKKSPDAKAVTLKAYLEVLLGITEATIKQRIALQKAANGMLKANGTIDPKILKPLDEEQKRLLVKLAADYAKQHE